MTDRNRIPQTQLERLDGAPSTADSRKWQRTKSDLATGHLATKMLLSHLFDQQPLSELALIDVNFVSVAELHAGKRSTPSCGKTKSANLSVKRVSYKRLSECV